MVVRRGELPGGCSMRAYEDFLYKDLDGSAFIDPGEHLVHGGAGLHCRLVAEPSLDGLDRAPSADQE